MLSWDTFIYILKFNKWLTNFAYKSSKLNYKRQVI